MSAFSRNVSFNLLDQLADATLAHDRSIPDRLADCLAALPEHPQVHAAKAIMLVMLARSELKASALEHARLAHLFAASGTKVDQAYAQAAEAATQGHWWQAISHLETVLRLDPAQSLAAKFSHGLRFMLGDKAGMLSSIARILRDLPPDHPHRSYLMGCQAFALEENGQFGRAEEVGRMAVTLQPRDAWGLHAVSHVHEMTGRVQIGIDWIMQHEAALRACNNFGGHLFWHLALFQLEQGNLSAVFDLYDREIRANKTDDFRDIANGASLLMRLELEGHGVGDRWEELAEKAEARLNDRAYVFADLHYLLALIGAGRLESAEALTHSIAFDKAAYVSQDEVARKAGSDMAQGLLAFAQKSERHAYYKLHKARALSAVIGGSDAQRDVFEQVMIEAALRTGEGHKVRHILDERLAARGGRNAFAQSRLMKIGRKMPPSRGGLAVMAALAFARPMPTGH